MNIINDIDQSLEQLVKNAEAIEKISHNELFSFEKKALEDVQESLLKHIFNMQEISETDLEPLIEKKLSSVKSSHTLKSDKLILRKARLQKHENLCPRTTRSKR